MRHQDNLCSLIFVRIYLSSLAWEGFLAGDGAWAELGICKSMENLPSTVLFCIAVIHSSHLSHRKGHFEWNEMGSSNNSYLLPCPQVKLTYGRVRLANFAEFLFLWDRMAGPGFSKPTLCCANLLTTTIGGLEGIKHVH
jgi:hypothetical protein